MGGLRFILTLVGLLAIFVGGGFLVDHWNRIDKPTTAAGSSDQAVAPPAAAPEVADAAAAGDAIAPKAETRIRKEFDAEAANAAAEAEGKAATDVQGAGTGAPASATRSLNPELVSLDTVRLSAESTSVIAGQAPSGVEVTLLANGKALGKAMADESGAWTIVLDEPVAPGTYKLALSAIAPGGAPIVRELGEETVEQPVAEVAPATSTSESAAASEVTTSEPAVTEPAKVATAVELPPEVAVTVPAPVYEPAGVPPDLTEPTRASAAEPADAIADTDGVSVQAPSAPATSPVEIAESGDASLTDQAGDVADGVTTMFTDWLKATREQAEEAAKTFTLATAGYNAIAPTLGVVTMSGHGPAKAKVQVLVDKVIFGSTEIADTGRWLIEVPRLLTPGPHDARAQILAVDGSLIAEQSATVMGPLEVVAQAPAAAGDAAPATPASVAPLVLAAITYESMGPKTGRVTIAGRAAAGAAIVIDADGKRIGSATADDDGNWLHASDTWLEVGAHAIRAEHVSASGEVLARTMSELVRLPAGEEIAASPSATPQPPSTEMALADEETAVAKPPKRRAQVHLRKRAKAAATLAKKQKRSTEKVASRKKDSGYQIINVHKGKELTKVRVRMPGRKGKIVSYMVPKGPGWVRAHQGDSLWGIADKWYGSGRSYPVIAGFNNKRVLDPDRIWPRQRLHVP